MTPARGETPAPKEQNAVWAMDFVHDSLVDRRRIRALTIAALCASEAPWIEVATSSRGSASGACSIVLREPMSFGSGSSTTTVRSS